MPDPDPVARLLAQARERYTRVTVAQARQLHAAGSGLVDIRPAWQRATEGEIEGSVIVERNHLEWRLHPESEARIPEADAVSHWVVVCSEGYTSSLAADALNSIGVAATDIIGGVTAWRRTGAPVLTEGITPADSQVRRGTQRRVDGFQLGAPDRSAPVH